MPALPLVTRYDKSGIRFTRNWTRNGVNWTEEKPTLTYNRTRETYSVERQSINTHGFKRLAKLHKAPVNAFYYKKSSSKSGVGSVSEYYIPDGHVKSFHIGCMEGTTMDYSSPLVSAIPSSEKSSLDRQCSTKVRLKLKDEKTNIGNFIGEREQAGKMFVNNVTRVAKAITHLRKGHLVDAAGALGISIKSNRAKKRFGRTFKRDQASAIANGWLELQFGIKPLLDDIKGAAESLARSNLNIVEGRVSASLKRNAVVNKSTPANDFWKNTFTDHTVTDYEVKYVVRYSVDLKLSHDLTSIGLTNPMGIGWELMPWSFVVDWVIPIGDFISSLDATVGLSFLEGSVTTFERTQSSRRTVALGTAVSTSRYFFDTMSSSELIECRRTPLNGFPQVALPAFKNPFGQPSTASHIGIAIALITQAVDGIPMRKH